MNSVVASLLRYLNWLREHVHTHGGENNTATELVENANGTLVSSSVNRPVLRQRYSLLYDVAKLRRVIRNVRFVFSFTRNRANDQNGSSKST